jgi:ethanolamine permease
MSVFGAILMYIISMLALFKLRRTEPDMERSFNAPFYPYFPAFALFAALVCMCTMIYFNVLMAAIFCGFLFLGSIYFYATHKQREIAPLDALIESVDATATKG